MNLNSYVSPCYKQVWQKASYLRQWWIPSSSSSASVSSFSIPFCSTLCIRRLATEVPYKKENTVQFLYNTPHYNTDLDIGQSCCGSQIFLSFCLFDLILYVSVNNLSVMSGQVFLCLTSTKLWLMCLAQGHKAVTPKRVKPVTLRSRVKTLVQ